MFPRPEKIQAMTMTNKQNAFGLDAPIGLMAGMLKMMASDSSSIPIKMLGTGPVVAAVHAYFWIRQQVGRAVRRIWMRT